MSGQINTHSERIIKSIRLSLKIYIFKLMINKPVTITPRTLPRELHQPRSEARCRAAVDDVVIEEYGRFEVFADCQSGLSRNTLPCY